MSRVFITGFGIITSIGNNTEENFRSLINNRHGFAELSILDTIHRSELPCSEIKIDDGKLKELAHVSGSGFTRTTLLGLIALREALQSASLGPRDLPQSGLISSTTTGGIREFEKDFDNFLDLDRNGSFEQFTDTANPGEHAERLADTLGIRNYVASISTACSSSANAIMQGASMIRSGRMERIICGGTEALSKFTINGFNALMILDSTHCRPFDNSRKGLNLGEGAAYLVLESEREAEARGATPLAEVLGYGNANDAFHQTASSPEGTGAYEAMRIALVSAGISPAQIDYINAHGTATENNDLSESTGLKRIFGDRLPAFSSTKPFTGHTLAAAGSIEAVYSILSIQNGIVWPNLNFSQPILETGLSPAVALTKRSIDRVLSNSFGFGGNTSSLIISRP
jgi:3-oxoacyl-(acyl-carrier-protein) synthase